MPTRTASGKIQCGFALDPETYGLIQKYATTSKGHGAFVREAVREYDRQQREQTILGRLETLLKHIPVESDEKAEK